MPLSMPATSGKQRLNEIEDDLGLDRSCGRSDQRFNLYRDHEQPALGGIPFRRMNC